MPFKEHPVFIPPNVKTAKIWRFMDLAKYLSVLDRASLYFSRIDKLANFDPFEGFLAKPNVIFEYSSFEDLPEEWRESTGINTQEIFNLVKKALKKRRSILDYHREITFVSSWYLNEHESAAMWKLYLSNNAGIAIQSTYQRLIDSLKTYTDFEVHIGRIKYIDYEKEAIPDGNLLSPFLYKRRSYKHEDELRALIWTPQHGKNDILDPSKNKYKDINGIYVRVLLDVLIEKVYVAPNAPEWIVEQIKSVSKKYDLDKDIIKSDLISSPLY